MVSKKQLDTDSILGGLDSEDISPESFTHPAEASGYPKSAPLDLPAERIMSGKRKNEPVKKRTMVLELDPRTCRRWRYYDRFEEWFTYENCKDLIDDMYEREQEIPGIVSAGHNLDIRDSGVHQRLDRIENHGLVIDRKQVFVGNLGE